MYATLFSDAALDALREQQTANMPDVCYVMTRTLARIPGGVAREVYALDRAEPCRLSLALASEIDRAGAPGERRTYTLARPYDAAPLDGTERIVCVLGDGVARTRRVVTVRPVGARQLQSFDTVQVSGVTEFGVPQASVVGARLSLVPTFSANIQPV
jgi:hypothetical protein